MLNNTTGGAVRSISVKLTAGLKSSKKLNDKCSNYNALHVPFIIGDGAGKPHES